MNAKLTLTLAAVLALIPIKTDSAATPCRSELSHSDSPRPRAFVRVEELSQFLGDRKALAAGELTAPNLSPQPYGPVPRLALAGGQIAQAVVEIEASMAGEVLVVDCLGNHDHETVQGAIDAASSGDVVVVLPNTCNPQSRYFENIDFLGKAITVQSLLPEDPEVVAATVIDGSTDDLSTVRIISGEGEGTILNGLTITGGSGTPETEFFMGIHVGGGILCIDSSPTIRNCHITANHCARGGGVSVYRCNLQIRKCDITYNQVDSEPGNGWLWFGNGAGLHVEDSSLVLEHSKILNNVSVYNGEGYYCYAISASGLLLVSEESASQAEIRNCEFRGNRVAGDWLWQNGEYPPVGGAIEAHTYCNEALQLSLRNLLLVNNESGVGAGLSLSGEGVTSTIQGCTVAGNVSVAEDPWTWSRSAATVSNSVIYYNVPPDIDPQNGPLIGAEATFSYSNVETTDGSVVDGPGNIINEPAFVDAGGGDYHLLPTSPCINGGDPNFDAGEGETDIDGDPRVLFEIVDMGGDEAQEFADCNGNGMPDGSDISYGVSEDCNANGVPDECDIDASASNDCDGNGVPDECQPDCDKDGTPDVCELPPFGDSEDCNDNDVPDDCDIAVSGITAPEALNSNAAFDSGNDNRPQLTTDGAGNWVAVWNSSDSLDGTIGNDLDILFSRSTDNGVTWTDPAPLNTNAAIDSGDDHNPQLTTDGAGNWLAVWDSYDDLDGTIGTDVDILLSRSTDNGTTWTFPEPLNTNAASDSGDDYNPQITTDGAGTWVAVWQTLDDLDGTIDNDGDILSSRSTDNGVSWTAPRPLNTNAASDSGWEHDRGPQLTTDGEGNWVAVWYSSDDLDGTISHDWDILFSRSTDAGLNWTAPALLNTNGDSDSAPDWQPQLATDGTGNWVAVWYSWDDLGGTIGTDRNILFSLSTDDGATWSASAALNTSASIDSGRHTFPQVTTDGAGNWLAVWSSRDDLGGTIGTDPDILFSRSTNKGVSWTAPRPLNTNAASNAYYVPDQSPQLTTDGNGNWVAVWKSYVDYDSDILTAHFQLISADCNDNGIPDECEDCNNNVIADECDIADGTSFDCNANNIPDECDLAAGISEDCNENEIPDECEPDTDGDEVTDDCDACPNSELAETIVIDDCDTGVSNMLFSEECSMTDLIAQCSNGAENHGQLVGCVAHLTNAWKRDGLINGRDKGRIQKCLRLAPEAALSLQDQAQRGISYPLP